MKFCILLLIAAATTAAAVEPGDAAWPFGHVRRSFHVRHSFVDFGDVPLPPPRPRALLGHMDDAALEASPPQPPPRPPDLQAAPMLQAPSPEADRLQPPAATPQDNDDLRAAVLASGKIVAESLPPLAAPGACGIAAPVRLEAIVLFDKDRDAGTTADTKVKIVPAVVMRASLALAVADWIREDLTPAFKDIDKSEDPSGKDKTDADRLARIEGVGAYECRDRNHIAGAKLSEHATGNAMDMHVLVTAKGRELAVAPAPADAAKNQAFLALMKKTACTRFMTVLGPGADAFHAEHLHVDLEARRSGAHLCQWNLPAATAAAPLPPPRP